MLSLPALAQDSRLEHARQVNLDRLAHLPNFEADEVMVRYQSPRVDPPRWKKMDTIESAIGFRNGNFTREHVAVNGKPWNKPELPNGSHPRVGFGFEIKPLFDPACRVEIQYAGAEEIHSKPASTYSFRSPPDGCFGSLGLKNGTFSALKLANPPRVGRFTVDEAGGNLIHFEMEAVDRPKWLDPSREIDTWDYMKVGDTSWLLPVAYENYSGGGFGGLWHVVVEYKNFRHFESSTDVTFK